MLSVCLPYLLLQWLKQTLFKREGTADSHKKHCEIQILSSSRFCGGVLCSRKAILMQRVLGKGVKYRISLFGNVEGG
jgi:hypothetical protein